MTNIKLKSSDDQVFDVDVNVVMCSRTIKTMLEDLGMPEEGDTEPIPLPNVTGPIFEKVLEWAIYHKDDPPYEEDEFDTVSKDNCKWDQEFLDVDKGTLFAIIQAANYLDVKGLLDCSCKYLASLIKGKNPEEIRKICNITVESNKKNEESTEAK